MNDKLLFAIQQYTSLLVFGVAFWGLGRTAIACCRMKVQPMDPLLMHALCIVLGMGFATMALQGVAAGGLLSRSSINVLLILGWALTLLYSVLAIRRLGCETAAPSMPWVWPFALLPLALAVPTFLAALHPPHRWDELMYHLPHARQWAETGQLQVNEWLRYPWSPYNLGLLYAAGLIIRGDVFTHLLHALAGWLAAVMVFRLALQNGGRAAACLATCFWLWLTRGEFGSSQVDMGVAVFILGALVAHLHWERNHSDRVWLVLSGLLLGCAVGSKYQALGLLPFFFGCLLVQRHRVRNLMLWSLAVAVPCIYWYARNFFLTGDPFNPLGGSLFGYTDWNAGDMQYQLYDLKRSANWPAWYLWPAVLAPLFAALRQSANGLRLMIFAGYGFLVWLVTSHYDRYLMPVYPVLALLSAYVCCHGLLAITRHVVPAARSLGAPARLRQAGSLVAIIAVTVLSIGWVVRNVPKQWTNVAGTEAERHEVLSRTVWSYGLTQKVKGLNLGKTYQWGLEGAIYFLPTPVYGDHFGPWRYRELDGLSARQLANKLRREQFQTLLVHRATVPGLEARSDFFHYFVPLAESDGDKAYTLKTETYADKP